jgi:Flp pilus assembly pilin Flp
MNHALMRFLKSEDGATMAEYAVMLAILMSGAWVAGEVMKRSHNLSFADAKAAVGGLLNPRGG